MISFQSDHELRESIERGMREWESKKQEYRQYLESFLRDYREHFEKVRMFQGYLGFEQIVNRFWL